MCNLRYQQFYYCAQLFVGKSRGKNKSLRTATRRLTLVKTPLVIPFPVLYATRTCIARFWSSPVFLFFVESSQWPCHILELNLTYFPASTSEHLLWRAHSLANWSLGFCEAFGNGAREVLIFYFLHQRFRYVIILADSVHGTFYGTQRFIYCIHDSPPPAPILSISS